MKVPFDPATAFACIETAVAPFPKAGLHQLMDEGYTSAFEQLVACIISIRTLDEVMLPVARRLFNAAPTPEAVGELSVEAIAVLIAESGFAKNKALQIHTIARKVVEEHGSVLPCDREVLLSLNGVGPKCANLVLNIACRHPYLGVDSHVHRITNRWGYVEAKTPEKTLAALEVKLPQKYWDDVNRLLVPFGKNICTPTSPRCSVCPVLAMCQQIGVEKHR
jgi:endonuclease-3